MGSQRVAMPAQHVVQTGACILMQHTCMHANTGSQRGEAHLADKEEDVLGTHRRPCARRARPPQLAARRRAIHGLRQAGRQAESAPGGGSNAQAIATAHALPKADRRWPAGLAWQPTIHPTTTTDSAAQTAQTAGSTRLHAQRTPDPLAPSCRPQHPAAFAGRTHSVQDGC
jgi:hypothetical protein